MLIFTVDLIEIAVTCVARRFTIVLACTLGEVDGATQHSSGQTQPVLEFDYGLQSEGRCCFVRPLRLRLCN